MRHRPISSRFIAATLIAAVFSVWIGIALAGADDTAVKVFRISYRQADELVDQVRLLLSPSGAVVADETTNTLIVKDYPANIENIASFLQEQDRMAEQVLIRVISMDRSDLKQMGLDVRWGYRDEHWAFGTIPLRRDGLRVQVLPQAWRSTGTKRFEQTLRVMSGVEAKISAGRLVSRTDWLPRYARRHGYIVRETRIMEAATGFVVRPRVTDQIIRIEIAPFMSYFDDGSEQVIVFRNAATTLSCRDGETVLIGSSDIGSENLVWNVLGGFTRTKQDEQFYLTVTPEIVR